MGHTASWLRRYTGSTGTGLGGILCVACMGGMWATMGAAAGMGGAGLAGAFAWVPVAVLRPLSGVLLGLGLLGLVVSRLRHHRWAPLIVGAPAVGYLLTVMYGWPQALLASTAIQASYLAAILLLLAVGGWELRLARRAPELTAASPRAHGTHHGT